MPRRKLEQYAHPDKKRLNNPPAGLVSSETDPEATKGTEYAYDPHLDPALQWAGKAEHTSFTVPTVSLHVHERIDPKTIIRAVKRANGDDRQESLFGAPKPLREAVDFYRHKENWSNRLIAGDSLLVMNSLLQKENMKGKVQCVYMDPPYGIKYGSNFQAFVNKKESTDGKDEDLTTEPEMIKAFRDTWELGIHSYLSYLRDRLLLARALLTHSGSVFVQIGDENVHRVGLLLDDIFGAENRMATITYATTSGSSSKSLPEVADYLLWYAKDKDSVKYRQLYESLNRQETIEYFSSYAMVELRDGTSRTITDKERFDPDKHLPKGARTYRRTAIDSQGVSTTGRSKPYQWNGKTFRCGQNRHWSVSKEGLDHLDKLDRLVAIGGPSSLAWKRYEDEVPGRRINNVWARQIPVHDKRYVVQTAEPIIQRAMMMTTDPGDLVFDPTCGSGATAAVAEQWGRRWITCDTSRVATTLAKQHLMTATYHYYKLAHPDEGVGSGFEYKQVPYVSAATLAYNEPPKHTTLYDQPKKDTRRARITGPFTVEAVPSPTVLPIGDLPKVAPVAADESVTRSGATMRHREWCDELLKTGIRGKGGQRVSFARVESLAGRWLNADCVTKPDATGADRIADGDTNTAFTPRRVVVAFGPEHAPLEQKRVEWAIEEARTLVPKPEIVVFAAFQFDPEAAKDIDETNWGGVQLLKAQMNADLQTDDLKKERASNESFWLVGQPDVQLDRIPAGEHKGKYEVRVNGFDYFNTKSGDIDSGGTERIAVWMLDTDYDGRSLFPNQVFFPMAGENGGWARLAKNLRAEIDEKLIGNYSGVVSLPFELGGNERVAVKIVDDRGIESLKVVGVV